jgi:hypothetical protein
MRSIIIAALMTAAFFAACSCSLGEAVRGNGNVVTEARSLADFSSIIVEGQGSLRVHKGEQGLLIVADSNLHDYIETSVSGTELRIGIKPFTSIVGET